MPLLQHLKATTGTAGDPVYYFLGRSDDYPTSVQTILGVAPSPANEQTKPVYKLENILTTGSLIRITITYGSGAGSKTAKLVCLRSKLAGALDNLVGVSFKGALITSARIALHDTFS